MRLLKLSIVFFLMIPTVAHSQEEDSENVEGSELSDDVSNPAAVEFHKRNNELAFRGNQLSLEKKRLQETLMETKAVKNPQQRARMIKKLLKRYNKYTSDIKVFNKDRKRLRMEFPARGKAIDRRYLPFREQSLAEIEEDIGLDAEMTNFKKKVDRKYEPFLTETDLRQREAQREAKQRKSKKKKKKKRLKLEL